MVAFDDATISGGTAMRTRFVTYGIVFAALAGLAACDLEAIAPPQGTVAQPGEAAVTMGASAAPLDWEKDHPERAAWSQALRQSFAAELPRIGVPADIGDYCPAYAQLDAAGRVEALSVMAVAIARRESSYKPDTVYHEPPPLGVDSIGLFQLSYEDGFTWCSLDKASNSLMDPVNNITCAVGKMSRLIESGGVVASGAQVSGGKGLARYWSVIQDGSGHFKSEIQAKVRALPICGG
jgi:hypothetical protein